MLERNTNQDVAVTDRARSRLVSRRDETMGNSCSRKDSTISYFTSQLHTRTRMLIDVLLSHTLTIFYNSLPWDLAIFNTSTLHQSCDQQHQSGRLSKILPSPTVISLVRPFTYCDASSRFNLKSTEYYYQLRFPWLYNLWPLVYNNTSTSTQTLVSVQITSKDNSGPLNIPNPNKL